MTPFVLKRLFNRIFYTGVQKPYNQLVGASFLLKIKCIMCTSIMEFFFFIFRKAGENDIKIEKIIR